MILVRVYPRHRSSAPETYRLDEAPVTIGRAVDNDVVILDASVSAHHAVIERDANGSLILRDAGSTNGLFEGGRGFQTLALDRTRTVRVGTVWVEISADEMPVEGTVRIDLASIESEQDWSHGKGVAVGAALVVSFAVLQYASFEFLRVSYSPHHVLSQILSVALGALGFSLAAAVFSKVHQRRYQFYPLFAVVMGFSILLEVHVRLFPLIRFNLNHPLAATVLDELAQIAVAFGTCFFVARRLWPETSVRKRAAVIGAGLVAVIGAGYGLRAVSDQESETDADTVIALPLRSFAAETRPLTRVLDGMDRLENRVRTERERVLKLESERGRQILTDHSLVRAADDQSPKK